MTDGEALLAAILAYPSEDTPRLVYADWLDENGQPERAEFIRLHIAFHNTPMWSIRAGKLRDEYDEYDLIESQKQSRWQSLCQLVRHRVKKAAMQAIGETVDRILVFTEKDRAMFVIMWRPGRWDIRLYFHRGFVSGIQTTWGEWKDRSAILAAHPVQKVTLTTPAILEPPPPQHHRGRMIIFGERRVSVEELKEKWPGIEFELPSQTILMSRVDDPTNFDYTPAQ